jgi:hypothetical protein
LVVEIFGETTSPEMCERKCILAQFRPYAEDNEEAILAELDDFRHLYAHNFAGRLDAAYFINKKRQVLASDTPRQLTCGAQFNGQQLLLDISHLSSTQQRSETCWSAIEAP